LLIARLVDVMGDEGVHLVGHLVDELDDLGTGCILMNVTVHLDITPDMQVRDVDLGAEVRARRRALGFGQSTLAQVADVGLTSLRDLEQHR
jgi:hypothetical protein